MIGLTQFESDVMEQLLAGNSEPFVTLRAQFNVAALKKREVTAGGFFIHFSIPSLVRRLVPPASLSFGDVTAEVSGLEFGAGFVIHVKDGVLDFLEGYCYEEQWPRAIGKYVLGREAGLTEKQAKEFARTFGA